MEEIDLSKPYPDMSNDELAFEFLYLSDLINDIAGLNLVNRVNTLNHLSYVKVLLDERNLIN